MVSCFVTFQTDIPTITLTPQSGSDVVVGQTLVYELDMQVPENSLSDYELEILSPFNDSTAVARMCKVELISNGMIQNIHYFFLCVGCKQGRKVYKL